MAIIIDSRIYYFLTLFIRSLYIIGTFCISIPSIVLCVTNNTIFSSLILFNIRTIDLSRVSCKLEKGSSKISKDILGFVTATKNCKSCLCPLKVHLI